MCLIQYEKGFDECYDQSLLTCVFVLAKIIFCFSYTVEGLMKTKEVLMNPIEKYIQDLRDIHASGEAVKETSYYPALSNLLNEVGKTIKPHVHCIINIKNRGAGIPDGGLFTIDQLQRDPDADPFLSQLPARGAIEVKGTSEDILQIAGSKQVQRYLEKYGQVLVTNLREFVLVGRGSRGESVNLEAFRLNTNDVDFWGAATNPGKMAEVYGERLLEYLKRVMLHAAPLFSPEDVARFLASYARDARSRMEQVDLPALHALRSTLEEALGLKFEGTRGDHFFRSTLVQTVFYGIFSSWVLWCKQHDPADQNVNFSWREAVWYLHVPMIKALFEQIVTPTKLGPLGLVEVLDWTGLALNRVDRKVFFSKFEEEYAVQYFYEPFLQAFDPQLRKELGVWYTPLEIVQYMVARVDVVLREELGIEDGFADSSVYVLDPCCGTGAYLVEVLKRITLTLQEKGMDALSYYDVKKAATQRLFGFEILPAPFVIAHLQLGLVLQNLGVPLSSAENERVAVYLTNALTGWEAVDTAKEQATQLRLAGIPELKEERDAAGNIKRKVPILVILGNPPYNAYAGVSSAEENGLVEPYKEGLFSEWGIKKFNLDDLYVRFFRLAEQRIAEKTEKGVICYISNFSYLDDSSFVVMRQHFLREFDKLWFDCMNGDSRETGKVTPDGKPDPSVFSTTYNREGIKVGTTIGLMVRNSQHIRNEEHPVYFRQFWGASKRADLNTSLIVQDFSAQYQLAKPSRSNWLSFKSSDVAPAYREWPKLTDLCSVVSNGLMEKRGGALIDVDKMSLEKRIRMYYDHQVSWETLKKQNKGLTKDAARFDAKKSRMKVLAKEKFDSTNIRRYALRPFDTRWCYYSAVRPLWNEPRPTLWAQCWDGNMFLLSRPKGVASPEGVPFFFTKLLGDNDFLRGHAYYVPLQLRSKPIMKNTLFDKNFIVEDVSSKANLSSRAYAYLVDLGFVDLESNEESALQLWMHVLAIGFAPNYTLENVDGIRENWPRVPLPNTKNLLTTSAELGRNVAVLLDTENPVLGVTSGKLRTELKCMAAISRVGGGTLNPSVGDLAITVDWGHEGADGVTMPGKGKIIRRNYTKDELIMINEGAAILGLTVEQAIDCLGASTYDVYLNDIAYWKNVPNNVWDYTMGGYQVIKKWLSYRENGLLGRSLIREEVNEVMSMIRRIAAILLMGPALNANYQQVKHYAYLWPQ
jgi:hypothetical protein